MTLQSENGMLGIGPFPYDDEVDPDLINAGKQTVSQLPQSSFFDQRNSFAMIRGGHIDLAVLGGMEVSQDGDLANWMVPGKMIKGMGGAMDLVAGVKKIIVVMEHVSKNGDPKFIPECTLPLTGRNVVDMIITDLAVFQRPDHDSPFKLIELAPEVTAEDVRAKTERRITPSNRDEPPAVERHRAARALFWAAGAFRVRHGGPAASAAPARRARRQDPAYHRLPDADVARRHGPFRERKRGNCCYGFGVRGVDRARAGHPHAPPRQRLLDWVADTVAAAARAGASPLVAFAAGA